jgi:DNA-binding LacI/PurR family transcriptional regulator
LTCVDLDFHRAGALCVEHLAAAGHREVALLGAPQVVYERDTGFAHRTRDGFLETAARLEVGAVARPCESDPSVVAAAVKALLDERPGLTGLVVHNEEAVTHVLSALRELGRVVPRDVAVVAICPDDVAERSSPPLSSVQIPAEALGRRAVELLMAKLAGGSPAELTLLPPVLTQRFSV